MFGMGMTLTPGDFKRVLKRPKAVTVGVAAQYVIMPFVGFLLAELFGLSPLLATGVVLLGSCPGGTASNVITYLARGDLALSVTITSVSTLISPLMIPLLMYLYAGQWVDVPVTKLFVSAIKIILIPIALGLLSRRLMGNYLKYAMPILPSLSSLSIIFIVGVIVAANSESIKNLGIVLALVVIVHNALGFSTGYVLGRLIGMDIASTKAISIEVGMQNSGLGVALASVHFGALAALPSALFSVWHNISGSILAWWWRRGLKDK